MMDWIRHFDFKRKKIWWILFFAFLTLFVYGSLYEISDIWLDPIRPVRETGQRYAMLLFCFLSASHLLCSILDLSEMDLQEVECESDVNGDGFLFGMVRAGMGGW